MKQNINIEAEGSELILRNKVGDYVIIPKKHRTDVLSMIDENQHERIDALVDKLPVMEDYADDGSLIPRNQVTKKGRTIIFAEEPPISVDEMIVFGTTKKKDGSVFDEDIAALSKKREDTFIEYMDNLHKIPNEMPGFYGDIDLDPLDYMREYITDRKIVERQNKLRAERENKIRAIDAEIQDIFKKKGYPGTDRTFKREAERGAEYYKRNNIPYEIVSFYGDKQKIVDSLSGDDISDIVIMGHHGRKIAGVPLNEWNDVIKNAKYDRCMLGSCWGNHLVDNLEDVKNLYHTDGIPWEGVNPKANKPEDFYYPKGYKISNPK